MFIDAQPEIRHALDILPTHVRWEEPKQRASTPRARRYSAAGRSIPALLAHRNQKCIVKVSYTKNTKTRSWAAHGEYLQREHAQMTGERGLGFNQESNTIDIKTTLRQWQQANDPHVFKLILSPENGHKLDLQQHAKEFMQHVQKDLKTKLEWVAIDHYNTDYPHLHILVRGIDQRGKELTIEREYMSHGFRDRSEELATRVLGLRLERDIIQARERQVEREYVTELDRSIRRKAENSIVNYNTPVPDNLLSRERRLCEIRRLQFLENHGLAKKIGRKSWELSDKMELVLHEMQLTNDIIKSRAQHQVQTLSHEIPTPTHVLENKPLTGKVIGMGLENELKDNRYLLLEGIDGKVHYLQATNSIIKARDNFEFSNHDVITLERKKWTNEKCHTIDFIKVENHFTLDALENKPFSRIDRDVIEYVKDHHTKPRESSHEKSFSHDYAKSIIKRFDEFERERIVMNNDGRYDLAPDWNKKLTLLIETRKRRNQLELERKHQHVYEHTIKIHHHNSLDSNGGHQKPQDHDRER